MEQDIVRKLETDKAYLSRIAKLVTGYVSLGSKNTEYWAPEWDTAHDLLMTYAPLSRKDYEQLEKGHPKRFILPMTATQMTTMTTFIAQTLFGDTCSNRVEARSPADEQAAEHVNTLLAWNAEQQPSYTLGYLFVQDALTYNRGIFYHEWRPILKPKKEPVEVSIPSQTPGEEPETFTVWRTRNREVGGYCHRHLVSPYDFFADPSLPLIRAQEGRFMGHRFKIPWVELDRRSKLSVDHPAYVLPSAVEQLKKKKKPNNTVPPALTGHGSTTSTRPDQAMSRSFYERMRITGPMVGEAADNKDAGVVECVELWVRLVPKDQAIHDGTEAVEFQFLIANGDVLLSMNEGTYEHGLYPYVIAEGRPSGHYQFGPSWAFMLKGLQDHVDYLKNRHQEALQRTVGNVFVVNPAKVDVEEFLNPDKEGLIIPLKQDAAGDKISDVFQQVAIKDLTEGFPVEMQGFIAYSENVTGANNNMQGGSGAGGEPDSATEFAGTQSMAAGRMASVARLISEQAIVPQTKQFVSMFQQFMTEPQKVRYNPDPFTAPPELQGLKFLEISPDTIQGEFSFIAHDGAMPDGNQKQVAAIARLIEVAGVFPQLFVPSPGNIDPRQLVLAGARSAGLKNVDRFLYNDASIATAQMGQAAASTGVAPQGVIPPQPVGGQQAPGPAPAAPTLPDLGPTDIAPLSASRPSPQGVPSL
jgi:hypothetical protein